VGWAPGGQKWRAMGDDAAKIFVGGLPRGCNENSLHAWASQFGPVIKVDVKMDPMGTPRGFAFVSFESPETAEFVVSNRENNIIDGKQVDCKPAMTPGSAPGGKGGGKNPLADASNPKLFIGALPKTATQESVTDHFSQYGALAEVLVKLAEDGSCKGYAFLTFEDASSCKLILDNYDNNMFEGKWIDCKSVVEMKGGGKGKDMGKGKGMSPFGGGKAMGKGMSPFGGGKDMGKGMSSWVGGKDSGKGKMAFGGKDSGKGGYGGKDSGKGSFGGGYGGAPGGFGGAGGKGGYSDGKGFGGKSSGYGAPSYSPAPGGYGKGGYGAASPGGYGPAPSKGKGYGSAPYW